MKYKDFYSHLISEGTLSSPTVVVDVQPSYNKFCGRIVDGLCDFLNSRKGPIHIFYNGESMGFDDNEQSITEYYMEHGLNEEATYNMKFIDKGYAFFRNWMDAGMDRSNLIKAIRFMVNNRINDSREVADEQWESVFGNDWEEVKDTVQGDMINIPDVVISDLKKLSGCYLMGGAEHECLSEFRLLFEAFNINYKLIKDFTY